MKRSVVLSNRIDELQKLSAFVDETAAMWDIAPAVAMTINLVMEEAFTNIVLYAFPEGGNHDIDIVFEREGDWLTITLTDDGQPYDPTKRPDPDVSLPAGDRKIGGLGIFLIRKMTDHVTYRRAGDMNVLTMVKRLN